jgi:hypothetical protein
MSWTYRVFKREPLPPVGSSDVSYVPFSSAGGFATKREAQDAAARLGVHERPADFLTDYIEE